MKKAKEILQELKALKKHPLLIAIDGLSGAGKTTLATHLHELDPAIQLVEMDSFFLPMKNRRKFYLGKSANEEYDYKRILFELLLPFKKGITSYYNKYNWVTDKIDQEKFEIKSNKTLILDGTTSFHPALQDAVKFDYRIWVEASIEKRQERAKKRDDEIAEKSGGYNNKTKDYFLKEWIPMENIYFLKFRPDKKADIIVEN